MHTDEDEEATTEMHTDEAMWAMGHLQTLDSLGGWPNRERIDFIMNCWTGPESAKILSRVLGITQERVRQIRQSELRRLKAREASCT